MKYQLKIIKTLSLSEIEKSKITKFLSVGIVNTIFGYSIYVLFLFIGFTYTLALLFSTVLGVAFNYFNFGKFVFSGLRGWMVFCKFVTAYIAIYALNVVGLRVMVQYALLNPYAGQLMCIPLSVLLSWLLMNYWVFKR
jgi:putative flippase GtrA